MEKNIDVVATKQPDGTTLYEMAIPKPDMKQEVVIIVERGKGTETHIERD